MKILQINCVYGTGSTGKIVQAIHQQLQQDSFGSVVCYGRGEKIEEPFVHKTCGELYAKMNNVISRFTGIMYGGCYISTWNLIRIIQKEQPDIVHLHCINGYFVNIYSLIEWLKNSGIKTVLTLHAEFMYTANCGHALECEKWKTGCGNCPRCRKETKSLFLDRTARSFSKMMHAFSGFKENLIVTSVSPWLMERAKQSPILADKQHCVVWNGVDTDLFHPYKTDELRSKHGLGTKRIIFHATPSFNDDPQHLKGGYYVLRLAEMLKEENIQIIVAGKYPENLKIPENVIMLGNISDQRELAKYYSMADITVLTSKKETFSMVVTESLCCGTPVVGFKAGAPEQIAIEEYSEFVEWGDIEALTQSVGYMVRKQHMPEEISFCARMNYSKEAMANKYVKIYLSAKEGN